MYFKILVIVAVLTLCFTNNLRAQPSELTANLQTPMITNNLPDLTVSNGGSGLGSVTNDGRMIDADLTNFATMNIILSLFNSGERWIAVKDNLAAAEGGFPAGSYAGVVIENKSLLGIGTTYTLTTFLGATKQEEKNATTLLSSGLLSGQQQLGFLTTKAFDKIQFSMTADIGVGLSVDVYYTIVQKFATGSSPACNLYTKWSNSDYPVAINSARTGVTGLLTLAALVNTEAIVSPSSSDYATLTPGIVTALSTASVAVQSQVEDMTGGQLVGFELENTDILGVDLLNNITLTTYLNGSLVESKSGTNLLAGVDLLQGGDRYKVSMLTTAPFDEVVITFTVPVSVDLGATRIYNAFIKAFCEGPNLACNTMTSMDEKVYPWYFNSSVSGLLCGLCTIDSLGNVVDGDRTSAATVDITAAVGAGITLAFVDPLTPYPANTFVGFDIGTNPLLSVDVLNFVEIKLYNNGALVKDANNAGLLAGVSTLLLTGAGPNRSVIGFVSDTAFDEVRITFNNTAGANLGLFKVYDLVIQKGCATTLMCGDQKALTSPTFPTIINFERTGTFGGVCAGCQVDNPWNVITPSLADVARLEVTVGALQVASLSVLDPVNTYYPGTYTGFVIKQDGMPIGLNLLGGLTVTTYNNGVMQESVTAGNILELTVLGILAINPPSSAAYVLGFKVTKPFDEVRLSLSNAVNGFNVINVYYAFIDNSDAVFGGGIAPKMCFKTNPDFNVTGVNTLVNGNVSTNDIVVDGPASYGDPVAGTNNPMGGTLNLNPDGTYTFISTTVGVFTYHVKVCRNGQTVNCPRELLTITVIDPTIMTNPPIANTDIVGMTGPGSVTIPVRANDTGGNPGSTLTTPIAGALPPSHGTVDWTGGLVKYTPTPGFYGVDSFSYIICDVDQPLMCSEALVVVTVYPPDMANTTTAADDFVFTPEGQPVSGNVLNNDFDPEGDAQVVVPVNEVIAGVGTLVVNGNGTFTFTPVAGFTGSFNYPLTIHDDGSPQATAMSTLYIMVEPAAKTNPDVNVTFINVEVLGNVNTNDHVLSGTNYGAPTALVGNPDTSVPTMNPDGTYTFSSPIRGVFRFLVPVCPPSVTINCPEELLTITVLDPSSNTNPPIANTDIATTLGVTPVTLNTLANDHGGNPGVALNPTSVTITGTPSKGTTSINGTTGAITYTPNAGFIGKDTLTYQVCDSTSPTPLCATAIQIITVLPTGSANSTTANDDYNTTAFNTPTSGSVKTNDTDPEGDMQTVTAQTTTVSGKGTLVLASDGTYTFTPEAGFSGPVNFTYTTCDAGTPQACASATLYIIVKGVPDLTPTISLTDATFAPGETKEYAVNLRELLGNSTNDQTVFTLRAAPGYTFTPYDATMTSVTPSGSTPRAVTNSEWHQVSITSTKLVVKANTGTIITGTTRAILGFKVTRTSATSGSTGNVSVTITDDSSLGYDSNTNNNLYTRILTNQ